MAAVGSRLEARAHGGEWLLRIEDLDPPRERPGAAGDILATLDWLGLHWDGPVLRQSTRSAAYRDALERLVAAGLAYRCGCTRSHLASLPQPAPAESAGELYHPPICIAPPAQAGDAAAWRLHVADRDVMFVDRVQGPQRMNVARSVGDFVLQRRDGWFAYQLAVVVDDAAQGVTDVVRGADLLESTPRQLLLQEALGLAAVTYMHLPLAVDDAGRKLSKSADAPALAGASAAARVIAALRFLRQSPPAELERATVDEVWQWATSNWQPARFAGMIRGPVTGASVRKGIQEHRP